MRRSKELLERRKKFIQEYVENNSEKPMKVIVLELVDKLFISERTIWGILKE